ncbi:sulfatase [Halosquirtibacter xylanolyticus]|uniref:sulfatase n=1 Tax=Halosquirtibacter xylanolyticus TaxID=3374599 RepID=UPI003749EB4B|nr:sulfatase [Prolixibacteraceae bacterium]
MNSKLKIGVQLMAASMIACPLSSMAKKPERKIEKKPNILLFVVDDMGWQDSSIPMWGASVPTNRLYQTPNMERLASKGVVFTDAYASSPVCSPTRTAIMTGQNPMRTRISNWIPGERVGKPKDQKYLVPKWNVPGISKSQLTLPQVLKQAGYFTAIIGKGHLGDKGAYAADPKNIGFDVSVASHHAGHPGSYYVPYGKPKSSHHVPGLEAFYKDSVYLTDALTSVAVNMIDSLSTHSENPFFIDLSHYALHTPLMEHPELMDKYLGLGYNRTQARYASMVESMDASLGRVMDALQVNGQLDNTAIFFISDNGGLVTHGGNKKDGPYATSCFPLRLGKGGSYEGGIRIPMLVSWPGVTSQAKRVSEPVITDDLFTTFAEIAGVTLPQDYVSDGTSITPLLNGKKHLKRDVPMVWHYPHYWAGPSIRRIYPDVKPYTAIRIGDYKLLYSYDEGKAELYNLKEDIAERNNIVLSNPKKAKELCDKLVAHMKSVDAQTPLDRETGKPVAYPHL